MLVEDADEHDLFGVPRPERSRRSVLTPSPAGQGYAGRRARHAGMSASRPRTRSPRSTRSRTIVAAMIIVNTPGSGDYV